MDILDVAWLLGETLCLAWLACGAIVTNFESSVSADLTFHTPELPALQFHSPVNHRLATPSRPDIEW